MTLSGALKVGSQYHFHLETQSCLVTPSEDGQYEIRCASQWQSMVQRGISRALNIPMNKINTKIYRLGGAYGGKISRPNMVATACAIAAHALRRPVRIVLDLETNMEMVGKRCPYVINYELTLDDQNLLQNVSME